MTLLEALIKTAKDLNEPGELNAEYARGQSNLIVDAAGLIQDEAGELVIKVITHQIRERDFYAALRGDRP